MEHSRPSGPARPGAATPDSDVPEPATVAPSTAAPSTAAPATGAAAPPAAGERRTSIPGNFVRGALIGAVETVPGVSGGTVALVVGIYHQVIGSASAVIHAVRTLVTGPNRAAGFRAEIARVHWRIVIPVVIGMLLAVAFLAGPMAFLIEHYPVHMRGLFFGMVIASAAVPVRMILRDQRRAPADPALPDPDPAHTRLRWWHPALAVAAGALAFFLVSLQPTRVEPSPVVIICAAAVAVSALVLPGLSGSFLLLTFGLYEPTLGAVHERDFGYLGLFMIGAIIGLIVIVKLLGWLLARYHTATLAVLVGVMLGGLRTLWPWQSDTRELLAPPSGSEALLLIGLAVVGAALVSILIVVDARIERRSAARGDRAD